MAKMKNQAKLKSRFSKTELKKGIRVEMEHTRNKYFAEKIAKDHLQENPNYYKMFSSSRNKKEYLVSAKSSSDIYVKR